MAEETNKKDETVEKKSDTKTGPKTGLLIGAVGGICFVIAIVVFSLLMGVFSSSNVSETPTEPQHEEGIAEEDSEDIDGWSDIDQSFYDFAAEDDEAPMVDSNGAKEWTLEDSLAQMEWYRRQQREIAVSWEEIRKEQDRIKKEKDHLEELNIETIRLLKRRQAIEDANTIQMAKLFDTMKAQEVEEIMKNMTNEKVGSILIRMKKQNASKVMAVMPPERAAKISTMLIDLAEI